MRIYSLTIVYIMHIRVDCQNHLNQFDSLCVQHLLHWTAPSISVISTVYITAITEMR